MMASLDEVFSEIEEFEGRRNVPLTFMSINTSNPDDDEGWRFKISHDIPKEHRKMFPGTYSESEIDQAVREAGYMKPMLMKFKVFAGEGNLSVGLSGEELNTI